MRIKLVFPGRKMRNLEIRGKNHLIPSETLTTLAAVTPPQHEVTIEDENVQRLHFDDQPDLVGITVYTFLASRAYEIADHYRAKGVYVVLGGATRHRMSRRGVDARRHGGRRRGRQRLAAVPGRS